MKCDLGEIACAIDRLTDAVNADAPHGVPWFDVLTRAVIPVLLGVATLLVAWESRRIAKRSVDLVSKQNDKAEKAARLRERTVVAYDLVEMLRSLGNEVRGQATSNGLSSALIGAKTRPKLAIMDEPGGMEILAEVRSTYDRHPFTPEREGSQLFVAAYSESEYSISLWARDPDKYVELVEERKKEVFEAKRAAHNAARPS